MAGRISMSDILALSIEERLRLMEEIWETIADSPDVVPLTDEQRRELDRRLEAYRRDPNTGYSWSQVEREIKGRP